MNRAERRRAERQGKTTNPLAITWFSNSIFAPTGYGTQTSQVVRQLHAEGHHVAICANYGLQAAQMIFDEIPHYPMGFDPYSNDVIEPTFMDWSRQHPDATPLVIALYDAWPLKAPAWDRMPTAIWTMIDHLPAPPAVLDFLRKDSVTPLAASRFAQEQIGRADIESIYVPMAIDTDLYKPTPVWHNGDKAVAGRQLMGFGDDAEDYFVVSIVNANKSASGVHRKAHAENLLAFSVFAQQHDDVRLYIHTERNGMHGGINFAPLLKSLDIPEHKYRFVNQWAQHIGIPNEAMAALYTATDVLLAPTMGEGFGLTVAEAGACETPVIVSDFTCQPELVTDDSYLVGGQPWWDSYQAAWWQVPNVAQIVEALEAAYQRGRYRSTKQRDHIVNNYDAATVYETHWKPALEVLAAKAAPPKEVEPWAPSR
jgi:glycosyltransferase involved in cell wall biosynthesis